MPGDTETEFFIGRRCSTPRWERSKRCRPDEVARIGFKAMMAGEGDVVAGPKNKIKAAVASVTPSLRLVEQHRKMAEPGTAKQ